MENEDLEKKIAKARIKLMMDFPFFGHLALSLETIRHENLNPPTMATDGINLFWHPDFVKETSVNQLAGVICHECGHVMFLHMTRRQGRDPWKWNVACDYAVNDIVLNEIDSSGQHLELPEGCLHSTDYANKSAEYIYSKLPDQPKGGGSGDGKGGGSGSGGTLDSHEPWKDWEKNGAKDKDGNQVSPAELEQRVRDSVASAVTAARMAGKLSSNIQEKVEGILEPSLDWKSILREMIVSCAHNDFRLIPASKKHLWRGMFLPATIGEEINIAAVIDTSGSISNDEMKMFLSEIHGICSAFEEYTIYLFECDCTIQKRYTITPEVSLPNMMSGRGGTSYKPPLKVIQKEDLPVSSIIYLTDLYPNDGYPDMPNIPVIWVSVSGPEIKPPWGELINLPRGMSYE